MDGLNKDPARGAAAEGLVQAPKTDEGVDSTKQSSAVPPTPPIQGDGGGEGNEEAPLPKENPFDQYYSQLTHQQNMLQDSVRVTAYQRAILENAADFKVRLPPQPPQCPGQEHLPVRFGVDVERLYIVQRGLPLACGTTAAGAAAAVVARVGNGYCQHLPVSPPDTYRNVHLEATSLDGRPLFFKVDSLGPHHD